jgi:hypothetical protein
MSTEQKISLRICGLVLGLIVTMGLVAAQQPSPSPSPQKSGSADGPVEAGEGAGDFTVISSLAIAGLVLTAISISTRAI